MTDDSAPDPYRRAETVDVHASPSDVWALVTDIGRTGEWSPICQQCWWVEGDGPAVGARFAGRNEKPGRTWQTESTVVAAEPGREFAWEVGRGFVRWGYELEPTADGGTRLTESWHFTPAGLAMFADKYGPDADREIAIRADEARTGIPATLVAIKRIAEG